METDNKTEKKHGVGLIAFTILTNIGIPLLAWYGVHGVAGAMNLVKMVAGFTAIMLPIALGVGLFSEKFEKVPKWRQWMSHFSDFATITILAWYGWIWCSTAFACGWIATCIVYESGNIKNKKGKSNEQSN